MKIYLHSTLCFLTLLACILQQDRLRAAQLPEVRVGFIIDGPWEGNKETLRITKEEILALTRGEFDVRFLPEMTIEADWTVPGIEAAIDRLLQDPEVDILIAWGLITSDIICRKERFPKPVIAPVVLNVELQGIPYTPDSDSSGVENLSYVTWPIQLKDDLETFHRIVPFRKLTYLLNESVYTANPRLLQNVTEVVERLDFELEVSFLPVGFSAEEALEALPKDTEAIYAAPLLHLPQAEFDRLVQGLIQRRLPSFSLFGRGRVEQGLLASLSLDTDLRRVARRIALNLQRILLGEDAGSLPVTFSRGKLLTINMATARAIGVYPSWDLLTEADLLHLERTDIVRLVSLRSAAKDALATNLDLKSLDHLVSAGAEDINKARSTLLPQLEVSSLNSLIDRDRAAASFGSQGQRSLSGTASITQLLYSEPARSNLDIQQNLQLTREEQRNQLRLDIIFEASTAYLNILRGKALEQIQRENLRRTRDHLEIARNRVDVEAANRSELLRWQSEIATVRRDLIRANTQRNLAEIVLNRLLHRPLEESFRTDKTNLDLETGFDKIKQYVDNPKSFGLFRDFMAEEALSASPELRRLDAAIASQRRILLSAERAFWAPEVALTGSTTSWLRGGGGSGVQLSDLLPDPLSLPSTGNIDWVVALSVRFPLFTSGAKEAEARQSREELARLGSEREALAERIEQRIRMALHAAGASFASIKLAGDAETAARGNLELVTAAYREGTLSIIDLVDAQNASLVAEQAAANAVYDYLLDLMHVQRSGGRFDFFSSASEITQWKERLRTFFSQSGTP